MVDLGMAGRASRLRIDERRCGAEGPEVTVQGRYLSVAQLAEYVPALTQKAIYHLVADGKIPCIRLGRKIQFDKEKIDRWMERHSHRATPTL
jgi:excisionase family DNA binding protein